MEDMPIYFSDLNETCQKELMRRYGITSPEEMNWDHEIIPIAYMAVPSESGGVPDSEEGVTGGIIEPDELEEEEEDPFAYVQANASATNTGMSKDRAIEIARAYIEQDLDATESSYVLEVLGSIGVDAQELAELGLDYLEDLEASA